MDRPGIVVAVAGFLSTRGWNIIESTQFGDPGSGRFFMRVAFAGDGRVEAVFRRDFDEIAEPFGISWDVYDATRKKRVLIMVSKFDHCLNDLLYRARVGALQIEVPAIVSNHERARSLAETYEVPFHVLPVTPETKRTQEKRLLDLIGTQRVDLVVLARYMQVLSDDFCGALAGRAINIHHSFLPSFKGAKPYHQAFARGVKLIGATAHYVTADLDEGPIIEQDVVRIDHSATPDELVALGRDTEALVLARAVKLHTEHRVLLDGRKTVVF
jgi:formyltetrahydrofolate deformylase